MGAVATKKRTKSPASAEHEISANDPTWWRPENSRVHKVLTVTTDHTGHLIAGPPSPFFVATELSWDNQTAIRHSLRHSVLDRCLAYCPASRGLDISPLWHATLLALAESRRKLALYEPYEPECQLTIDSYRAQIAVLTEALLLRDANIRLLAARIIHRHQAEAFNRAVFEDQANFGVDQWHDYSSWDSAPGTRFRFTKSTKCDGTESGGVYGFYLGIPCQRIPPNTRAEASQASANTCSHPHTEDTAPSPNPTLSRSPEVCPSYENHWRR